LGILSFWTCSAVSFLPSIRVLGEVLVGEGETFNGMDQPGFSSPFLSYLELLWGFWTRF